MQFIDQPDGAKAYPHGVEVLTTVVLTEHLIGGRIDLREWGAFSRHPHITCINRQVSPLPGDAEELPST